LLPAASPLICNPLGRVEAGRLPVVLQGRVEQGIHAAADRLGWRWRVLDGGRPAEPLHQPSPGLLPVSLPQPVLEPLEVRGLARLAAELQVRFVPALQEG
jgi:hypothetical protein